MCNNAYMKTGAIVSLFAGVSLICVLLVIHIVFGRDIEPHDVSDLAVVRCEVPAEQNAFT